MARYDEGDDFQAGELNAQNRQFRRMIKALRADLAEALSTIQAHETTITTLEGERDELANYIEMEPGEAQAQILDLQGQIRTRDLKDAFGAELAKLGDVTLHEKATLEKVWAEAGFDPTAGDDDGEPDPAAIIARAREAAPFLFAPKAAATSGASGSTPAGAGKTSPKPPLGTPPGSGRGAADGSGGRFVVKRGDYRNPQWMAQNQAALGQAIKEGNLEIID